MKTSAHSTLPVVRSDDFVQQLLKESRIRLSENFDKLKKEVVFFRSLLLQTIRLHPPRQRVRIRILADQLASWEDHRLEPFEIQIDQNIHLSKIVLRGQVRVSSPFEQMRQLRFQIKTLRQEFDLIKMEIMEAIDKFFTIQIK